MRSKRNCLLSLTLMLTLLVPTFALPRFDEGMFTPDKIVNLPLMQKGLRIKPTDIYNPKGGGLSEAVVRLATGCSGEFVSPEGLILTNHHCAFDALVAASSVGKDYGNDGYRAMSRNDELSAKGYAIDIPKRTEDITARVLAGTENLAGAEKEAAIKNNIAKIEAEEKAKIPQGNTIRIQALNNGFFYYLYENQPVKDIRVVYAPPRNIGFFGGDPDNFEWSRHTGDFTFLRAYVAPDGSAAEYSPNNVPFKPKKFLTISLNGIKENDFVFIMGYPGGTTRYRESQAVDYLENVQFPFLVDYLDAWSKALVKIGEDDEAKRVKLQGEISNLNNSYKVYEGGVNVLRRADLNTQKKADEAKLAAWINANPARRTKYGTLLADINRASETYYATGKRDRLLRTFPNAGNTPMMKAVFDAINAVAENKPLTEQKRAEVQETYQTREPLLEREMIKFFLSQAEQLPNDQKFQPIETLFNRFKGKERRSAEESYAELIVDKPDFNTPEKVFALYRMSLDDLRKKYPTLVELAIPLGQEQARIAARTAAFNPEINRLRLLYMQAMSEMKNVKPYPDANFTQRFSYGYVKGYEPREAVVYEPFTTLKGVIEKDTGIFPFDVPQKLKDLQKARDFGRYGEGDSVPVNFLSTLDIIGGNSGSPILNAYGEQVGLAFDGNYEGLANDLFYSPEYGRTIGVDIRYVLFVTEKFGNAGWILNEMNIKGRTVPARRGAR